MKIVESKVVPIDSIRPNIYNPNTMRDTIYQFLKKSIKKRGFLDPVIVNKNGVIIDGEHRHKALKELGATEVEVKVLDITDAECKAETVNLNLTKGTFDADKLGKILLELDNEWGKEVLKENLVMEQKQIDSAIRAYQSAEIPESAPVTLDSVRSETTIKRGDVFALGNHVLMCGDATSAEDIDTLMSGATADILLTDLTM
jgi:hypothetical protein